MQLVANTRNTTLTTLIAQCIFQSRFQCSWLFMECLHDLIGLYPNSFSLIYRFHATQFSPCSHWLQLLGNKKFYIDSLDCPLHLSIWFQWSWLFKECFHDLIGPYFNSPSLILRFHITHASLLTLGAAIWFLSIYGDPQIEIFRTGWSWYERFDTGWWSMVCCQPMRRSGYYPGSRVPREVCHLNLRPTNPRLRRCPTVVRRGINCRRK